MMLSTHSIRVTRTARYFVSGDPASATEVWFLLHGYGQLADAFLSSCASIEKPGRLLVAPEGLSRFYAKGFFEGVGASWMTSSGREAEIEDYVAYLNAVGAAVLAEVPPGPTVNLLGFSQGAPTASRWAAMSSIPFARLVCWAGDVAHDIPETAKRLANVKLSMVFGTADKLITPDRKADYLDRLDKTGLEYELIPFEGGHRLDDDTLARVIG